ncbi:unnamed protein product [Protopolystoma xenopodis]|uniref:Uncharacterized protein n=1 Tax=Protopolystoma xenopodis TaxID=117903 RepID=A0A3S5CRN5_9PLAT|nr:unnamed protein product [Protopolystoma xenopodis]
MRPLLSNNASCLPPFPSTAEVQSYLPNVGPKDEANEAIVTETNILPPLCSIPQSSTEGE